MRQGLFLFVSALVACSGPAARPDAEAWPASPVASASTLENDTTPALPATGPDEEAEQPAVLFRCEGGSLRAYLVPGPAGDDAVAGGQMVPISLDSAPSC